MPWKECSAMTERFRFIIEWQTDQGNFAALCRDFGISRTLGYRYINRFLLEGMEALKDKSRAAHVVWNKTPPEIEQAILAMKRNKPRWGAQKLLGLLADQMDTQMLPAVSTTELILKRHGLVKTRVRRRHITAHNPVFVASYPNQIWSADFKGQFRLGNARYCYPLTAMDSCCRFILAIQGMYCPTFDTTKPAFQATFREFGMPEFIHTDNGEPFGCATSLARLTRLAVWFIELAILPVYSDPGHPEQNAIHERMHEDLKEATTHPPAYDLARQQRKFNPYRQEYNFERPHQALGGRTPAQLYLPSPRPYPETIQPWDYPSSFVTKRVCRNGAIRWGGYKWITVSSTLIEKYIGLELFADGLWRIYFRNKLLGYLDERILRIQDGEGRTRRVVPKV